MIFDPVAIFLVGIAVIALRAVYRLAFHPLRGYPGPKLASMSNLPYITWWLSGKLHLRLRELHDQYGEVVRIRPNALTYRNPQAWRDIFGHRRHGDPHFPKDPEFFTPASRGGASHMINANDEDHARQKRVLAHAFSEKSMREQEPLIQSYITQFIEKLGVYADAQKPVNAEEWLNFLTFDIIGDLAFGEPFGCLTGSKYHPWVAMVFQSIKTGVILRILSVYPVLAFIIQRAMPRRLVKQRVQHYQMGKETLNKRLKLETGRPDFITYVLRYNDERGMRRAEIEANATLIIQAGSETTATALSACLYYLLKHPDNLQSLKDEVRGAFAESHEIGFIPTAKLPYLNAVIEEALRLFPPSPAIGPRLVPGNGAIINGSHVPGGVSVSVAHYSAYRACENFAYPDSFIPDRWLDDSRFKDDRRDVLQPFSYGPRACLGRNLAYAEMRTVLSMLLWHFELRLGAGCQNWDDCNTYVAWEKPPLWIHLRRVERPLAPVTAKE